MHYDLRKFSIKIRVIQVIPIQVDSLRIETKIFSRIEIRSSNVIIGYLLVSILILNG